MPGFSTYLQNAILNWTKGTAMPTAPAAVYVGLFSADPTDAGTLTNEVTTTVRTAGRLAVPFGSITTGSGASVMANTADVDFGPAAGSTTVTYFGVFDAASAGNMLASGTIPSGSITSGTDYKFAAGSLSFTVS